MLTILVNAQRLGKKRVALPYSKFKESLLQVLAAKGRVASVRLQESPRPKLVVTLAYDSNDQPQISGARRLSTPGRRLYRRAKAIPYTDRGQGLVIVSTPEGVMDARQARRRGVGGELVCEIW